MKTLKSYKELKDFYQKNLILKDDNINRYRGGTFFKPALTIIPDNISDISVIGDDLGKAFNFNDKNRFLIYNYYKKRSHLSLITDILLIYLEILPSSKKEEIIEKIEKKSSEDFQKRLILLLELTGVLNTKRVYNYSYRERISIIVREFSLFISNFAMEIFENSSKPLVIEIRNSKNISSQAIDIFLSSLKSSLVHYPVFTILYGEMKSVVELKNNLNLSKLSITNPTNLYIEINRQYLKENSELYFHLKKINQELIYLNKNIPKESEDDIFDEYFESLSPMCKKLLGFFLFFEGKLFLNSIQYIKTEKGKYPSNELSILHKDGIIHFYKNFAVVSSNILLENISKYFNGYQFLKDNISNLSDIINSIFKESNRVYYEYHSNFYNKIFGVSEFEEFKSTINKYESDGESLFLAKVYEKNYQKFQFDENDDIYYYNIYLKSLVDLENYQSMYEFTNEDLENYSDKKKIIAQYYKAVALLEMEEKREVIEIAKKGIEYAKRIENQLWLAKFYHLLGDLYHKYYDLEPAVKNYQEAQVYYKNLDYNSEIIKIYYNLGKIHYQNNDLRSAMDALSMGILFYQKSEEFSVDLVYAKINYLSAIISNKEREFDLSFNHFNRALNIFYTFMDYNYLTKCYSNLSDLYLDREPDKSSRYLHKSLLYSQADKEQKDSIDRYWILSRYYLLQNNIGKSKEITKKALQYSVKIKDRQEFTKFIERIGDLYYYEHRFKIAKKCYKYAFKKYSNQGSKIRIPSILFKMATLYAETGRFNSSNKILDRLEQPDYEYFLNYDNQFNFNNIVIENFITQKRYDDVSIFLNKQESFLTKEGITLKNKIGFHKIKAVYSMINGDMEKGKEHYQKALDFCNSKGLIIEEIRLQLKIASVLSNLGLKKSSLKILNSLTGLSKEIGSVYLTKYILRTIYNL